MDHDARAGAGQVGEGALVVGLPPLGAALAERGARPAPRADDCQMEAGPSRQARSTRTSATPGKNRLVSMADSAFLQRKRVSRASAYRPVCLIESAQNRYLALT
jgi:hypothetical protein